jgi:hypothetical protein
MFPLLGWSHINAKLAWEDHLAAGSCMVLRRDYLNCVYSLFSTPKFKVASRENDTAFSQFGMRTSSNSPCWSAGFKRETRCSCMLFDRLFASLFMLLLYSQLGLLGRAFSVSDSCYLKWPYWWCWIVILVTLSSAPFVLVLPAIICLHNDMYEDEPLRGTSIADHLQSTR